MAMGISEKLIEFIAKETGVKKSKITHNAELQDDLGIYGDDATDLILAFGREFNIDLTKFMAADYIATEGAFLINKRKKLKVYHLEKALFLGHLDEDVINSDAPHLS